VAISLSVEFRWRSGDDSWTRAIERTAGRGVASGMASEAASRKVNPRWLACREVGSASSRFPLDQRAGSSDTRGGLTGKCPSHSRPWIVLELRAGLAASALVPEKQKGKESRLARWRDTCLNASAEPVPLLDDCGKNETGDARGQGVPGRFRGSTGTHRRDSRAVTLPEMFRSARTGAGREMVRAGPLRKPRGTVPSEPARAECRGVPCDCPSWRRRTETPRDLVELH